MKNVFVTLLSLGFLFAVSEALAHPGSGIVVDRLGNVYFVDTGSGIWKIDRNGTLTKLSAPAYHWMAFDIDKRLAAVRLPYFSRGDATVARDPGDPRILVSSDFPLTVGRDGALYYPWSRSGGELQIFRLAPTGSTTAFKTLPVQTESGQLLWLNGIVAALDGSIYYSEHRAIRRITAKGEIITVAGDPRLSGCDSVPEVGPEQGPYYRGLDVDSSGNVFVATTGCKAVVKISSNGTITTILKTSSPWSPTAVAVSGSDLYVLEYLHTPGDNRREWLPRVRRVAADGTVVTIAAIKR
ncbi:MAG: hypothetical protein A2X67_13160 [Ignavibacteria bacterium GWA2_55_11]|nr:MAG: hypothetical protein A2X67_13160 [Ignavibacteria bacterium GWA2_55_11]OGU64329.1 MAG: hypothetical protein A3C56_09460 [Ignavibacteria bacterium RIFCSPHIGHO2_02_FULL_56_12]OGU71085.1 MAG: hypothetical protein A3G43_10675 [Ignavibacteria bacterium RIFCSPLOWO2_12_FULL_56_21]OGU73649.1 MAG: hypothetical protein A3H45_13450 [Ignavibacteria bacterium RIFCSPLOWO2_02_FULL_55_14]